MNKKEIFNVITDYLEFVYQKAEEYSGDNWGWSMAELLDLSCRYVDSLKND